jgi:hypothetical protein
MNEIFGMAILNARKHLLGKHKNGLETKFSRTKIEQVFETRAKEIKNHYVVIAFCAIPSHTRNTDGISTLQNSENLGLVKQLRVLALDTFELDRNFLVSLDVSSQKDITK